jgi:hypothetical protein
MNLLLLISAAGNAPEISSTGGDTNIDLKITPKGSGKIVLDGISFPNTEELQIKHLLQMFWYIIFC